LGLRCGKKERGDEIFRALFIIENVGIKKSVRLLHGECSLYVREIERSDRAWLHA
jgi:hypothetical protein